MFPESLWEDFILNQIIELGHEFGSTTGRKRLVNWINLDMLIESIKLSGCTDLIINKCDVLESVGVFRAYYKNHLYSYDTLVELQQFISWVLRDLGITINFSANKEQI